MKKFLVAAATAGLLVGGAGLAHATPGPNGHNNYGLCNAYSQGSAQGQAQKQAHGQAFLGLEKAASDAGQSVADYCAGATPGGK